ncbi:hypothetical protein BCR36DRAFT_410969 [Piromyces finnis]|uniref:SH3 domain-containing protein n=1 Tax=Piromyces finnis TaxID=1754191 RepID=A0A1Y1VDW8_9FUNG|nr:hypothetical protein BCR36DRAFT_410969 [Piromyces finnis]|eukprot:ORX53814.1 hypothetical protein BCR36DRAFT_410969 [Piromyces finnis]
MSNPSYQSIRNMENDFVQNNKHLNGVSSFNSNVQKSNNSLSSLNDSNGGSINNSRTSSPSSKKKKCNHNSYHKHSHSKSPSISSSKDSLHNSNSSIKFNHQNDSLSSLKLYNSYSNSPNSQISNNLSTSTPNYDKKNTLHSMIWKNNTKNISPNNNDNKNSSTTSLSNYTKSYHNNTNTNNDSIVSKAKFQYESLSKNSKLSQSYYQASKMSPTKYSSFTMPKKLNSSSSSSASRKLPDDFFKPPPTINKKSEVDKKSNDDNLYKDKNLFSSSNSYTKSSDLSSSKLNLQPNSSSSPTNENQFNTLHINTSRGLLKNKTDLYEKEYLTSPCTSSNRSSLINDNNNSDSSPISANEFPLHRNASELLNTSKKEDSYWNGYNTIDRKTIFKLKTEWEFRFNNDQNNSKTKDDSNKKNLNNKIFSEINYTNTQNTRNEWIRKVSQCNSSIPPPHPKNSTTTTTTSILSLKSKINSGSFENLYDGKNINSDTDKEKDNFGIHKLGSSKLSMMSNSDMCIDIKSKSNGNASNENYNNIVTDAGFKPSMIKKLKNNTDLKETFLDFQNRHNNSSVSSICSNTNNGSSSNNNFLKSHMNGSTFSINRSNYETYNATFFQKNNNAIKHSNSFVFNENPNRTSVSMAKRRSLNFTDFSTNSNLYYTTNFSNKKSYRIAQLLQFFENNKSSNDKPPSALKDLYDHKKYMINDMGMSNLKKLDTIESTVEIDTINSTEPLTHEMSTFEIELEKMDIMVDKMVNITKEKNNEEESKIKDDNHEQEETEEEEMKHLEEDKQEETEEEEMKHLEEDKQEETEEEEMKHLEEDNQEETKEEEMKYLEEDKQEETKEEEMKHLEEDKQEETKEEEMKHLEEDKQEETKEEEMKHLEENKQEETKKEEMKYLEEDKQEETKEEEMKHLEEDKQEETKEEEMKHLEEDKQEETKEEEMKSLEKNQDKEKEGEEIKSIENDQKEEKEEAVVEEVNNLEVDEKGGEENKGHDTNQNNNDNSSDVLNESKGENNPSEDNIKQENEVSMNDSDVKQCHSNSNLNESNNDVSNEDNTIIENENQDINETNSTSDKTNDKEEWINNANKEEKNTLEEYNDTKTMNEDRSDIIEPKEQNQNKISSIQDLLLEEGRPNYDFSIKSHSCTKLNELNNRDEIDSSKNQERKLKSTSSLPDINKKLINDIFVSLIMSEHKSSNYDKYMDDKDRHRKYLSGCSTVKSSGYMSYNVNKSTVDIDQSYSQADIMSNSNNNIHTLKGFLTSKNKKNKIYSSIEKLFDNGEQSIEDVNLGPVKFSVIAIHSNNQKSKHYLKFKENDVIDVYTEKNDKYYGKCNKHKGWFPKNYVTILTNNTTNNNDDNNDNDNTSNNNKDINSSSNSEEN